MSYEIDFTTPIGWQCPICKRVYSPSTPMCYYCKGSDIVTVTNHTAPTTLKVPDKCSDCIHCNLLVTGAPYCMLFYGAFENQTKFVEDLDNRPDWCPIIKLNKELGAYCE